MLAHDRRVLDILLEELLESRTSELIAWAKTMLPVIRQSVRDARTQIHTGHQDIRAHFSEASVTADAVVTRIATAANAPATRINRPDALLLDNRQLFQSAQNQDGHNLIRYSAVFPRPQQRHVKLSDSTSQTNTN